MIADPVGHSLSPAIHNACFADKGMNKLYLPLLVQGGQAEFDAFLDNILARPWLDFRGFSVTIPHKHSALEYVRRKGGFIEPLADKIGAANTLTCIDGRTGRRQSSDERTHSRAYNTDYAGALDAITQGMGIERQRPAGRAGRGGRRRRRLPGHRGGPDRRRRKGDDLQPHGGKGPGTRRRFRLPGRRPGRACPGWTPGS